MSRLIECNSKFSKRKTNLLPLFYLINYASLKLKNKAAILGIYMLFKPNQSIYQRIRYDYCSINPLETAGIYRINYHQKGGGTGAYIRKTKLKIKECIAKC